MKNNVHSLVSVHASERIHERLSLNVDQVVEILDDEKAVEIGRTANTHKIHWLFYSVEDNECFIAIRDGISKTLVTVLPLDFSKKMVNDTMKIKARSLIDDRYTLTQFREYDEEPYNKIFYFDLYAVYMNLNGRYSVVDLGSFHKYQYGFTLEEIQCNVELREEVLRRMKPKVNMKKFQKFLIRLNAYDRDFERKNWFVNNEYLGR